MSGKVARYCLAHAHCPVLAVPPPALARELGHGLLGWVFWHRPLTPDQVLRDRGKAAAQGPGQYVLGAAGRAAGRAEAGAHTCGSARPGGPGSHRPGRTVEAAPCLWPPRGRQPGCQLSPPE